MDVKYQLPETDNYMQSQAFQEFLETHLTYILENYISQTITIEENDGAAWAGDFYGLLYSKAIPFDLHYITLRVNGFLNSGDYDGSAMSVLIPNDSEISILKAVFKKNNPLT